MKVSKIALLSISAAMLVGLSANASEMTIAEKLEQMRRGNTAPKAVTTASVEQQPTLVITTPVVQRPAPVTTTPVQSNSAANGLESMMARYGINTTNTVAPQVTTQPQALVQTTPVVQTPVVQQPTPVTTTTVVQRPAPVITTPVQSNNTSMMARYGVNATTTTTTTTTVVPQTLRTNTEINSLQGQGKIIPNRQANTTASVSDDQILATAPNCIKPFMNAFTNQLFLQTAKIALARGEPITDLRNLMNQLDTEAQIEIAEARAQGATPQQIIQFGQQNIANVDQYLVAAQQYLNQGYSLNQLYNLID